MTSSTPLELAPKPESLLSLQFPSDPQVSPDGQVVVFVLAQIEEENLQQADEEWPKPRYRSRLWRSDGGAAHQLTHGESGSGDSSPRWSPDGQHLAFIRHSSEVKGALMLMPMHGGEAKRLTHFKGSAFNLQWSPDGRYLSFMTQGDHEDKRDERGEARVITKPLYRADGADFLPAQPAQLWLYDLEKEELKEWHAPELPIGQYQWWPDSRGVVFTGSRSEWDRAQWVSEASELQLDGTVRPLTDWGGRVFAVVPHPDGQKALLWGIAAECPGSSYGRLYLWEEGKKPQQIAQKHDYSLGNLVNGDAHVGALPGMPVWLDDQTLIFSSTVRGSCGLFKLDLATDEVSPHVHHPEEVIAGFTTNANGMAYIRESAIRFPEVELNGQVVTDLNARLPFTPIAPEEVTFKNELGEGQGWVILPEGEGPFPALLNIHGGPHTDYGHAFNHEFQLYAAHGYGVCYSNPRGSAGYGEAWQRAIHGCWGTVDMDDLMNFFDRCLDQHSQLDHQRSAIMGGSYGGYMTNWITSQPQHAERFKAAITDRCICNFVSFSGMSDIGLAFMKEVMGLDFSVQEDADKIWEMSPLRYVQNVKTPTLIVHSVLDHRCPIGEAEQWYSALNMHKVPTRLVRFPAETHELSRSGRPDRRMKRLEEYLGWMGEYL